MPDTPQRELDKDAARRLLRHPDYVIQAHAQCILDKLNRCKRAALEAPMTSERKENARCCWPLGTSGALSVTCARPKGHDGPHRSSFELMTDEATA